MSKKVHLTLAVGDYESIRALKEGTVKPDGIELTVLTDMNSDVRHWRMLRNREFDVAELSMSNYLMAKSTHLPFTAIPVFLHRRFRRKALGHSQLGAARAGVGALLLVALISDLEILCEQLICLLIRVLEHDVCPEPQQHGVLLLDLRVCEHGRHAQV